MAARDAPHPASFQVHSLIADASGKPVAPAGGLERESVQQKRSKGVVRLEIRRILRGHGIPKLQAVC
jgi:hypothetical protein